MDVIARNEIMENHSYLIKAAIRRNMTLLKALRLDLDDVYQDLAMATLKAIDGFNPEKSASLAAHISAKLQYAVLDIKASHKPCGMTGLNGSRVTFTSVESCFGDGALDIPVHDSFDEVEMSDALAVLTTAEREALRQHMAGIIGRKKNQCDLLAAAQEKIKSFYMPDGVLASC